MKVLTATRRTQGQRHNDYHWAVEFELVTPVRLICSADQADPDGGCGCGRGFAGLNSHKATTTAMVRDLDGFTFEDLMQAVHGYREQSGYDRTLAEAEDEAAIIAETADEFDAGTVLELRLDDVHVRAWRLP